MKLGTVHFGVPFKRLKGSTGSIASRFVPSGTAVRAIGCSLAGEQALQPLNHIDEIKGPLAGADSFSGCEDKESPRERVLLWGIWAVLLCCFAAVQLICCAAAPAGSHSTASARR